MHKRKASVLFIETPQFETETDETYLDERDLATVLMVDEDLVDIGRLHESTLGSYKSVFAANLADTASLERACREILKAHDIVAVAGFSETSVLAAAWVAERLGVRGIGFEVARLCRNKHLMMTTLAAAGIHCPKSLLVDPTSTVESIKSRLGDYPLICKPVMGFSSFGVVRVDSDQSLERSVKQVSRKNRFVMGRYYGLEQSNTASQLLVQSYVGGIEVAVDGYVQHGKSHILSVIDKPDVSDGPYFEDRSHIVPSEIDPALLATIERLAQSCIDAVSLNDSPFHIELRINDDEINVLEIGARAGLIGSLRRAKGIDLIKVTLALKLGEDPPITPSKNRFAGSVCLTADRPGTFEALINIDAIKEDSRIVSVRELARPGQRVAPPPDMTGYIAIVSIDAETYPDAQDAIQYARNTLRLDIS